MSTKKTFGLPETNTNTNNTNTNEKSQQQQADLYLNVLFKFGRDFVSLNYGIGLDTMPDSKLTGEYGSNQNAIRDLLIQKGEDLEPGESTIIFNSNKIRLELRRKGKLETKHGIDEDLAKAFLDMLL